MLFGGHLAAGSTRASAESGQIGVDSTLTQAEVARLSGGRFDEREQRRLGARGAHDRLEARDDVRAGRGDVVFSPMSFARSYSSNAPVAAFRMPFQAPSLTACLPWNSQ